MKPFLPALQVISTWAVSSQQQARRNAMIASTRLAQRRAERIEVEDYLAHRTAQHEARHDAPPAPVAHG